MFGQFVAHQPPAARAVVRFLALVAAVVVTLTFLPLVVSRVGDAVSQGFGETTPPASYDSCPALWSAYPQGVAAVAAVDGLTATRLPAVDDRAYEANAALDVNRDGIACERGR